MYEVGVSAGFEAAHRLVGDFGPATRLHGHSYRLDVVVRGERLKADGTLFNVVPLQQALAALVGKLHYQNLDEVPELAGINTTMEALAHFCWEQLAPSLRDAGLSSLLVRVWENSTTYAAREDKL
ncbi:MAG: 6-carboxytetrahydropterin synthase [Chloroflexaceae bacterium]|jgi:6-pyruvoyltetrahydropterin/6-carboxytetrahydropterin synthase|nr:6-carboxytetrahydropterin synthase [Chloroflexaceae bacterium]